MHKTTAAAVMLLHAATCTASEGVEIGHITVQTSIQVKRIGDFNVDFVDVGAAGNKASEPDAVGFYRKFAGDGPKRPEAVSSIEAKK